MAKKRKKSFNSISVKYIYPSHIYSSNWTEDILMNFYKIISDKPKKGIRMQKTSFLINYHGEEFTFTIQRGDKLNK